MGRFTEYANSFGMQLEEMNNQAMRRALEQGFKTLLASTKMDSGRAAYHWQFVTAGADGVKHVQGSLAYRADVRGHSPVGSKGSGGSSRDAITSLRRAEVGSFIRRRVSGRNPDTQFYYYNPVFDLSDSHYAENATLREALREAANVTMEYYLRLMRRYVATGGTSWGIRKGKVNV